MTKIEARTGLTKTHISVYLTIIGLLIGLIGTFLVYAYKFGSWQTTVTSSINILLKDNEINKLDHIALNIKLKKSQDTILKEVDKINAKINFLNTTKQNKKVLTPNEYQHLGSAYIEADENSIYGVTSSNKSFFNNPSYYLPAPLNLHSALTTNN